MCFVKIKVLALYANLHNSSAFSSHKQIKPLWEMYTIPVVERSLFLFFKLVAKRLRPEDLQTHTRGGKIFILHMKILCFLQGECIVNISVIGRSSKDMLCHILFAILDGTFCASEWNSIQSALLLRMHYLQLILWDPLMKIHPERYMQNNFASYLFRALILHYF